MGVTHSGSDEETALKGIETMEKFYHRIGMPVNMRELGIAPTDKQITAMADRVLVRLAVKRVLQRFYIRKILKKFTAWQGK